MLTIVQKRNASWHSLLSAASAWEPQAFRLPLLSGAAFVYVLIYFGLWQDSAIAQCAQLQPQEDFPFFLSLTSLRIMTATISTKINDTTMVLKFSVIQSNILTDSFPCILNFLLLSYTDPTVLKQPLHTYFYLCLQLRRFLVRANEHIHNEGKREDCEDHADYIAVTGE